MVKHGTLQYTMNTHLKLLLLLYQNINCTQINYCETLPCKNKQNLHQKGQKVSKKKKSKVEVAQIL